MASMDMFGDDAIAFIIEQWERDQAERNEQHKWTEDEVEFEKQKRRAREPERPASVPEGQPDEDSICRRGP